jgi:hypothetical protein
MDSPSSIIVVSAVLGLLLGGGVVALRLSAFHGFVIVYFAVLIVMFLVLLLQAPFIFALLGTLVTALFSFVPATGGFIVGAMIIRYVARRNVRAEEVL